MLKGYIVRRSVVTAMMLRGLYRHCCNGSQDVNVLTCLICYLWCKPLCNVELTPEWRVFLGKVFNYQTGQYIPCLGDLLSCYVSILLD